MEGKPKVRFDLRKLQIPFSVLAVTLPTEKKLQSKDVNQLVTSMNYVKQLIGVLSVAVILTLSFSNVASAERAEKFVNVGYDSDGDAFLLDTTTMGKREQGFGSVLKVYQNKNKLISEFLVNAACGDETLSIVGARTYSQNGIKLTENKVHQSLQVRTNSPGSQAMSYYCHSIGARGW
ncbi:MAG: hypothetical protein V7L23_30100 [Nostoc sp.]|uniref:hypothetical protein n=1 Tax=Nostoc sp. TaxID=1180 RepID=UPI002FF01950